MGMLKMRCTTTPNGPPYIFANQTYIRCFCPDYTGSASRLSSAKLGGGGRQDILPIPLTWLPSRNLTLCG